VQPLNRCGTYRLLYSGLGKLVDRSLVDETCLVVDIEPKGGERGITKIGKDAHPTAEKAEADVKRLCKGSKADSQARQQRYSVNVAFHSLSSRWTVLSVTHVARAPATRATARIQKHECLNEGNQNRSKESRVFENNMAANQGSYIGINDPLPLRFRLLGAGPAFRDLSLPRSTYSVSGSALPSASRTNSSFQETRIR
jgi:hypothetical protein